MADNDAIQLRVAPGLPGTDGLDIRVSPEAYSDLEQILLEHEVRTDRIIEFSQTVETIRLAVTLFGSAGMAAALANIFHTFIRRHDGKRFKWGDVDITGYSEKQLRGLIESVEETKAQQHEEWKRILGRPSLEDAQAEANEEGDDSASS